MLGLSIKISKQSITVHTFGTISGTKTHWYRALQPRFNFIYRTFNASNKILEAVARDNRKQFPMYIIEVRSDFDMAVSSISFFKKSFNFFSIPKLEKPVKYKTLVLLFLKNYH